MSPIIAPIVSLSTITSAFFIDNPYISIIYCASTYYITSLITDIGRNIYIYTITLFGFIFGILIIHSTINTSFPVEAHIFRFMPFRPAGFQYALEVISRTAVIFSASFVMLNIDRGELIRLLILGGTPRLLIVLAFQAMTTIEIFRRRSLAVACAQRARGIATAGPIWTRAKAYPAIAIPSIVATIVEADQRASALQSRGFGRNPWQAPMQRTPKSRVASWKALIAALVLAVCFVIIDHANGK